MNDVSGLWKLLVSFFLIGVIGGWLGNDLWYRKDKPIYQVEPEMTTAEAIETHQRIKWAESFLYWDSLWRADTTMSRIFKPRSHFPDFLKSKLKRDNK